ncbi:MAG: DEAD/DEAH box helicase, partial [Deltaproteobacteria bacterium]|nr:DEAD/DEAH box helicase [Deltaproteobacteria bacterium]
MNTFNTFNDLQLPQALAKSLGKMNFLAPTPIQQRSIPFALEGKDILGTAQTGTGKTGAFGIPLLTNLYSEPTKQALILCPTRELAAQINQVLRQMGKGLGMYGSLVVGGESFRRQRDELERGADYIVATPGRLNDHLQEGTVDLSGVNFLVLDEVDRMLDMGFAPQIKEIMKHVSKERQTLL